MSEDLMHAPLQPDEILTPGTPNIFLQQPWPEYSVTGYSRQPGPHWSDPPEGPPPGAEVTVRRLDGRVQRAVVK